MSGKSYITVVVAPDGACKVEGHDFHGPDCDKALAEIEAAIGGIAKDRKYKPEHFQRAVRPVQKIGRG